MEPMIEPYLLILDEATALIQALALGMKEFTDNESDIVCRWARDPRTRHALLEATLHGQFTVAVNAEGQVTFRAMAPFCADLDGEEGEPSS